MLKIILGAIPIIIMLAISQSFAYDPGNPDSLVIGNLDGSSLKARPGDTLNIPIWLKNDEEITGMFLPIAADYEYIVEWTQGALYGNLNFWQYADFWSPDSNQPVDGYSSQTFVGLLIWLEGPILDSVVNTQNNWQKILDFKVALNSDYSLIGEMIDIIEGDDPPGGGPRFSNDHGLNGWNPTVIGCSLKITSPYEYLPGDANMGVANWPPMVTNADVTYLVNYLGGKVQPCLFDGIFYASGDANGNCIVTNSDVTYLINYFRGGSAPTYCPSYPPAPPVQETYPLCFMGLLLNSEREHDSDLK